MYTTGTSHSNNLLLGHSVYIVGHLKPDLDAIVSAYAYQAYRHSKGDFNYIAVRCDSVNAVTKWAFEYFKVDIPMYIGDVSDCKIVLVDHTDPEQRPNGWENAEIIEVLDHHKLKLETSIPPKITIRPYGSTSTLIAYKMISSKIPIPKELAGLMLAAIFDDTLALRSPITTYEDRSIAGELSSIAGIPDLEKFAKTLFSKKDTWSKMTPGKMISTDYKDYTMGGKLIRISQVETMDNRKLEKKESDIVDAIKASLKKNKLDMQLVMLTDLLSNDCILISGGQGIEDLAGVFETKLINKRKQYLPGVLSRKKQIVPKLVNFFKEKYPNQ